MRKISDWMTTNAYHRESVMLSDVLHPLSDMTTTIVVRDMERLVQGDDAMESDLVRDFLREQGIASLRGTSRIERLRLHDRVVGLLQNKIRARQESNLENTYEMLLVGRDSDLVMWSYPNGNGSVPCSVKDARAALGMPVPEFLALDKSEKLRVIRRATHRLRRGKNIVEKLGESSRERGRVHEWLRQHWASGPLRVERPQASSLHLMIDYDVAMNGSLSRFVYNDSVQSVVVENDWGASVPPIDGEWHTPYPLMCWEFRISGVRVLTFTESEECPFNGRPEMWLIYGHDGHWVMDDYFYNIGDPVLPRGISHDARSPGTAGASSVHEFRGVADCAYRTIRAVCIMLDAEVARSETVPVSTKIVAQRRAERRAPPRDHYVVRLVGVERRAHSSHTRLAGSIVVRSPQRGHWRKGTWVHYDDPNSGKVRYTTPEGAVHSKTWRRWHFAGDPKNIMHKEYRV